MVIADNDLKIFYSGTADKNGPGGPMGGMISSNNVFQQTLDGGITQTQTMFFDVTDQQASSGMVRYFGCYLKNTHGTQTATNIKIWQNAVTPGDDKIRLGYSGAAANTHDPLNTSSMTPLYDVPLTESFSALDDDRERAGFYVASKSAPIFGQTIVRVELYLQRVGSPTGNLDVKQRKLNSETVNTDFGSIDVTTINNTTPTLYTFEDLGNTGTVHVEDIIAAEYTGGTSSNYIKVFRKSGSPVNYMHVINYDGNQWRNVSDFDLCGKLYKAGTTGENLPPTGVTFENPVTRETAIALPDLTASSFVPFWLRQEVPANASNFDINTFELTVEFDSPDT